jgi:hypothetical protein
MAWIRNAALAFAIFGAFTPTVLMAADLNGLLQDYQTTSDPLRKVLLENMVENIERGVSVANRALIANSQAPLYCLPEKLHLTGPQILDMMRRMVQSTAPLGVLEPGLAVMIAVRDTFPCK